MTRQEKRSTIRGLIAQFQEQFPAAFPANPRAIRPLKIGIAHQLAERLPETDPKLVSLTLLVWTRRTFYLKALLTASMRVDLDGTAAGEVSDAQRDYAKTELKRIYATLKSKKTRKGLGTSSRDSKPKRRASCMDAERE